MKLFRYISLAEFVEITVCQRLRLKHPDVWPDKYEGYFHKALMQEVGRKSFEHALVERGISTSAFQKISEIISLYVNHTYCTCCSGACDSVLMWSAYNYENRTIMLEFDEDQLRSLDDSIQLVPVKYDLENFGIGGYAAYIESISDTAGLTSPAELLSHKRACFSYENEVRIMSSDFTCTGGTKVLSIPNLNALITKVLVHPLADETYIDLISDICNLKKIQFAGKSTVYSFNAIF